MPLGFVESPIKIVKVATSNFRGNVKVFAATSSTSVLWRFFDMPSTWNVGVLVVWTDDSASRSTLSKESFIEIE
jgi:hypothetical protein